MRRVIVVGYYNVDVKAGKFKMVALNIDPMNADKEFTLDELFPYNDKMAKGTGAGAADQIQTWDYENQCYRYYFMYYAAVKGTPVEKAYHWVENDAAAGYPIATAKFKTGSSVFYFAKDNDNAFSIPGQVPNEAAGVLKHGFNMIGVGFPTQWNPNDAGKEYWNDTTKFAMGNGAGAADQIQYWDEENQRYRFFFLYYAAVKGSPVEKAYQWVEDDSAAGYPVLDEKLDTGDGFFYYRQKEGEIEFKPGLKLN